MKKSILSFLSVLFISLLFSQTINAQTNKEETDFFQSIFGMEKKAIVAEFLGIDSADPFWVLYDEYETKRKELGQERLEVLTFYVESYNTLTNDQYDLTIANMIALRKKTDKLMDQFYKKIKKTSGSKVAAQFFQLEGYFLTQIRAAIFEEIPYIGEFDN
jgi:microcystin degradation protein MlrC